MGRVQVKVVRKAYRRTAPGGVITLSRRDARLMSLLGRVEILTADAPEKDVAFTPSEKLGEVITAKPKRSRKAATKESKEAKPARKRSRRKKAE